MQINTNLKNRLAKMDTMLARVVESALAQVSDEFNVKVNEDGSVNMTPSDNDTQDVRLELVNLMQRNAEKYKIRVFWNGIDGNVRLNQAGDLEAAWIAAQEDNKPKGRGKKADTSKVSLVFSLSPLA